MAYSDSFPATRPVFQSDFANGGRIDPRITFSRPDTPPTYAAPSAVHYWSNEKHLSSENLLTYSSDISQSVWTKDQVTETGGQSAPDGGTDAYKLTENSATNEHRIYISTSSVGSASLTFSAYLKYIGRQWVRVRLTDSGGTDRHVWFDIQNGTKGTEDSGMTGTIAASGGGYYKITATISNTVSSGTYLVIGGASGDGNVSYAGSGADAFAVWGMNLSTTGQSTLNETSGQIHREYAPTLKSVSYAGQPRFEYSPTDSASMGLLIEGQAQNLFAYSDDFANQWTITGNVNVSESAGISPTGELNADLIYADDTAADSHYLFSSCGVSAASHTFSVYAKYTGVQYIQLQHRVTGAGIGQFDLVNGTFVVSGATGAMEPVGNGWYRCSVTETQSAGVAFGRIWLMGGAGFSDYNWDGDSYSGVLLFGAQYEQSSFASSLISTSGSAVTRASDSASAVTADIGYTGGPVTVVGEVTGGQGAYAGMAMLTGAGITKQLAIVKNGSGASDATNFSLTATDVSSQASFVVSGSGGATKLAACFNTNDYRACADGGAVASDTSGSLPDSLTTFYIGRLDSGNQLNAHIKRIAIYSEALSNSNLQSLTK